MTNGTLENAATRHGRLATPSLRTAVLAPEVRLQGFSRARG